MRLTDIGSVSEFVGKATKLLAFEALDHAKVHSLPMSITGVHFAAGWAVLVILSKEDSASGKWCRVSLHASVVTVVPI